MQDTVRTLYVLCGIPYSGKSTFADKDPVLSGLPKLSSDRLILEKAERLGTTYDKIFLESIKDAEKEFLRQVNGHLEAGQSFVIDRTNGNPKSRMKLCRKAKEHGFRTVCIYFEHPSAEEIEERIGQRKSHILPKYRVQSFRDSFVLPTLDEGFDAYFVVRQPAPEESL